MRQPVKWVLTVITISILTLGAWPSTATAPQLQILIDSGSPYFVPASPSIVTGTQVRWENPTPTQHTITHNTCVEESVPCAFDSGIIEPNGAYTIPTLAPGRYPYHCRLHPIMRGILIVTDQSALPSQT